MLKVCDDIFLEIDESVIDLTKRFHKPNPKGLEGFFRTCNCVECKP
jgi:hypothetical protein